MLRIRTFSGSDFFSESGSGSAKVPDSIRKIRIRIVEKKRSKTVPVSTSGKIVYFMFSILKVNTVFFGQVPPKPNQKHNLDPIGFLMDGTGSAKKPGSIRIRNTDFGSVFISLLRSRICIQRLSGSGSVVGIWKKTCKIKKRALVTFMTNMYIKWLLLA